MGAARGRARQMNAAAASADAPWLLFLHADVRLPGQARAALVDWLAAAAPADFGTFAFALDGVHWFWRFIELGQRIRERTTGLAYGDQGLLLSSGVFRQVGGFPDLPLMEDVAMLRRLRRRARWRRIPAPLLISARRFQEEGRWRGLLRNISLVTLYLAGVPAERLARFYPARRATRTVGAHPILLVFAKNPEPGRVKTRLASAVGDDEAARIYRDMGRRVVDQLRRGPYRLVAVFDPPDAGDPVGRWLGRDDLELRPQAVGDLGERLEAAFREAWRESDRVLAVGTDAPAVDRALVEEALLRLASADVVLGPASDGGYYLIGLRRPAPELFRDIPWSTSEVLAATRARARELGMVESLLPTHSDVDTLEDWRRAQGLE
jgi:hypothetical protein